MSRILKYKQATLLRQHILSSSTQEAEVSESLSLRSALPTQQVTGQTESCGEAVLKEKKKSKGFFKQTYPLTHKACFWRFVLQINFICLKCCIGIIQCSINCFSKWQKTGTKPNVFFQNGFSSGLGDRILCSCINRRVLSICGRKPRQIIE